MPNEQLNILSRSVSSAVQCLWAGSYGIPPVAILLACAAGVLTQVPWVLHQRPVAYLVRPYNTPALSHLTETCAARWRLLHGASPNSMGCLVSWGPLEERSWWRSWGCIGLSAAPCWAASSPLLLTGDEACAAEIQCVWLDGLVPSAWNWMPKNSIFGRPILHFLNEKVSPFSTIHAMKARSHASCSSWELPWMMKSSLMCSTPSSPWMVSSMAL